MRALGPPYPVIRNLLNQGRIIPFLGSGASLGDRNPGDLPWGDVREKFLPTATELADHLARSAVFPEGEAPELAKVAQYYNLMIGRILLDEELHDIFDHDFQPTTLHKALSEMPSPLLIVTTNYDDLIERAFVSAGKPYHLVAHTTDPKLGDQILWWPKGVPEPKQVNPNELDIDLSLDTVIYKMHGTVDRGDLQRDQFVITEDDYIDFLARMTKNKAIPAIFAEPFQTRPFLFLGYGLWDWNLRVVLNRIEKDLRRRSGIVSWAIQYRPSSLEESFWDRRGVKVFDMTITDFMQGLVGEV